MFCKIFTAATTFLDVIICKKKHFYNIFMFIAQLQEVDGSKTFLQMFILPVTTVYLQAMFNPAKNVLHTLSQHCKIL